MKFTEWEIAFNTKGTENPSGINAISESLTAIFNEDRPHARTLRFSGIVGKPAYLASSYYAHDCDFERIMGDIQSLSLEHPGTVFEIKSNFNDENYTIDLFENGKRETLAGALEVVYPEPAKIFFD